MTWGSRLGQMRGRRAERETHTLPSIIHLRLGNQLGRDMASVVKGSGEVVREGPLIGGGDPVTSVEAAVEGAFRAPEIHGQRRETSELPSWFLKQP